MIRARLYRVQMKLPKPFGHARATRSEADDLVLVLDVDGVIGVGECVPRDYVTGETVEGAFDAISKIDLDRLAAALDATSFADGVQRIAALELPGLAARCAVELALLDVLGKRTGTSLAALALPHRASRRAIPKSRALDLLAAPEDLTRGLYAPDHVKLKGSTDAALDLARTRAVRELFGDRVTISIDANMAWTRDEALARWDAVAPYGVAWLEEPLAQYALADYRALRERGVRVMLDESLCAYADGERALAAGACDLFNIRISKHGGLIPALRLAELAHGSGVGIHLGVHPGQTGVLGAAGAHFMASVGALVACEGVETWIGTGGMPERIIAEPLRFDASTRRCEALGAVGLGVTPVIEVIERHATQQITLAR